MYKLSEIIRKALATNEAVNAIVAGKVYPLIADQEIAQPFITYKVQSHGQLTKDKGGDFTATILSFHNTYNQAIQLNEAVMEALEQIEFEDKMYYFTDQGAEPGITENHETFVQQIITIKK